MAVLTLVMCGGLCDRIGCLLSGVYLKQKHDCTLRLVWDINSSCMARYDELFENDFGEVIHTDNILYENRRPSIRDNFFFNSNLSVIPKDRIYHGKFPPWDWLTRQYKLPQNDWLLFTNCFLPMIPEMKRGELISLLKPLSAITQEVDKFCIRHDITQKTIGAHLRLTDTGDSGTLDNCKNQITELISSNSKARIFLCSDDEESAREIQSMYPNTL